MSFDQTFNLVNNTGYTLVLDTVNSDNLSDAPWPAQIPPHTSATPFVQTGFSNVNPIAIYMVQGASPANSVRLNFYCAGVDPLLHVHMTLQFAGNFLPGSAIAESNTDNGHSYNSTDAPNSQGILEIETNGNGSSRGTAIFTIG